MSDKTVRTHTHASNRAKPREAGERKVVFKSFLDNPFKIQWPSVPINVQNSFLAHVVSALDGVSDYRNARGQENRKRKRPCRREGVGKRKKRKVDAESMEHGMDLDDPGPVDVAVISGPSNTASVVPSSTPSENPPAESPTILRHVTVGINEVTKRLESQIASARSTVTVSNAVPPGPPKPQPFLKIIFVCRADIDPPILIEHLPYLVTTFNSSQLSSHASGPVKIVPLPKGAEFTLAGAMGLRRVAVMAIDVDAPELSAFSSLLDSVPTLTAAWLVPPPTVDGPIKRFIPTHIKQVRTSAPKDMKAVKEKRAEGKAAAKERRKIKLRASQNEVVTKN